MTFKVIMPEMGEGVTEATIVSWLKQEGDQVNEDDALLEVETDKVTVEIPSEADGVLLKILAQPGSVVRVGDVLAVIGQADESLDGIETMVEKMPVVADAKQTSVTPSQVQTRQTVEQAIGADVRVSPVVARMVKEHNLDLSQIAGTGRNGRITKRDVETYMKQQVHRTSILTNHQAAPVTSPVPISTASSDIPGELMPLTGMRRAIAEHMVMSKRTSPHATTIFEFDFSTVAKHRAEHKEKFSKVGVKLTYMPYIIMATAEALRKHPMVNSSWTDNGILIKKDIHVGMATAVPNGLVVPVIFNADEMNLLGLARKINDLAERARTNRLSPQELQGGTFTVTNHGASGSIIGAPIINQPQAGILGIGVIEKRVKVINDAIAIRPCAYVSFSFDHRILDGATADAFVMDIKHRLENFA